MKIRPGDVVEAQVSFVAIPLKQQKYKVLVVLRAITLLDCSPLRVSQFSAKVCAAANKKQNASIARRMSRGAEPRRASQLLKRKIGYEEDEEHDTREKLSRMRLDWIGQQWLMHRQYNSSCFDDSQANQSTLCHHLVVFGYNLKTINTNCPYAYFSFSLKMTVCWQTYKGLW